MEQQHFRVTAPLDTEQQGTLFSICVVASLPYMSICTRVVVAVTFEQVDNAPDTETGTERDNEGLKNGDCLFKKCHIVCQPESD